MDGAPGLGSLMTVWQTRARTDALIAAVLASTLLGLIILIGTNTLARLLLKPWLRELKK
jgi:ABC-type nitrate/sulfonate/bicarbonate transport system permease component